MHLQTRENDDRDIPNRCSDEEMAEANKALLTAYGIRDGAQVPVKPVDPFLGQIKPLQEVSELKRRGDIKREEAKRFFQSLD